VHLKIGTFGIPAMYLHRQKEILLFHMVVNIIAFGGVLMMVILKCGKNIMEIELTAVNTVNVPVFILAH
jgi:hypothetical protein